MNGHWTPEILRNVDRTFLMCKISKKYQLNEVVIIFTIFASPIKHLVYPQKLLHK